MMVWLGGIALLAVTAIETLGVAGRHVGIPLHGAIELIQPMILIAGTIALIMATISCSHAKVHLLVDRMSERGKDVSGRVSDLATALFFAGLLAGSFWVANDLLAADERSEVIGVPWAYMRAFVNLGLLAVIAVLLGRMVRRRK